MKNVYKDLTGINFGRWIVLGFAGRNSSCQILWRCKCICGSIKLVTGHNLKAGESKSCGCARNDKTKRLNGGGSKAPYWKGGRLLDKDGYIILKKPEHPNARKSGYVFEHVYVMSQIIGRPLYKGETVHHKNGVRSDNEPLNLDLRLNNHGSGQSIKDLIPYWKKMLALYETLTNE